MLHGVRRGEGAGHFSQAVVSRYPLVATLMYFSFVFVLFFFTFTDLWVESDTRVWPDVGANPQLTDSKDCWVTFHIGPKLMSFSNDSHPSRCAAVKLHRCD